MLNVRPESNRFRKKIFFHYPRVFTECLAYPDGPPLTEVGKCVLGPAGEELKDCSLYGFCGAGEKTYCCMIFLHILTEKEEKVTLLRSKIRVSPLKSMSIFRLEVTAAGTLAIMKETIARTLEKRR